MAVLLVASNEGRHAPGGQVATFVSWKTYEWDSAASDVERASAQAAKPYLVQDPEFSSPRTVNYAQLLELP